VRDGIADILDNTAITDVIAAGAARKRRDARRKE
jgi:hypothetical protein